LHAASQTLDPRDVPDRRVDVGSLDRHVGDGAGPDANVATHLDLAEVVPSLLRRHPGVSDVRLCGSRQRGDARPLSDWDFLVETKLFLPVAAALPEQLEDLKPLAAQWERLSIRACFMLVIDGPTKVDLIFGDVHHDPEPPWIVDRSTLAGLDAHFWDWMLWLASKAQADDALVESELVKMHRHLLEPLGTEPSRSLSDALAAYGPALARWETRLGRRVDRRLGEAVRPVVLSVT
jgi:predicted nucleotidyltransferase